MSQQRSFIQSVIKYITEFDAGNIFYKPFPVKVIGGGGGGSTSPADISDGIGLSPDIDSIITNTLGVVSYCESLESRCISIDSKLDTSNGIITTLNTAVDGVSSEVSGISGKLPDSLGTKSATNSFSVVLASDQVALPVNISSVGNGATETTLQQVVTNTQAIPRGTTSLTIRGTQTSVVANFTSTGNTKLKLVRGHAAAAATHYITVGTGTYVSGTSLSVYSLKISGGVTVSESLKDWGDIPFPIDAPAGTNIWIVKATSTDPVVTQAVGGLSAFITLDL